MRLIDADKIFDGKVLMVREEAYDAVHAVIEKINNAPTVDAEPVVRCKDCVNYSSRYSGWHCYLDGRQTQKNDFCSWGERGEDEAD